MFSITKSEFYHDIVKNPEPENVGTFRLTARIFGDDLDLRWTNLSFTQEFIENDECPTKEALNYFLMEVGINDCDIAYTIMELISYVDDLTSSSSNEYSPGCALDVEVWLDLVPDYPNDDDSQIEEAVQISFDETSYNIPIKPASKLVVKSLPRKRYKKISSNVENCRVCLEEFNNGDRVLSLPCGHEFDDDCIVKWFETSHVCPLCRFELPCEDH